MTISRLLSMFSSRLVKHARYLSGRRAPPPFAGGDSADSTARTTANACFTDFKLRSTGAQQTYDPYWSVEEAWREEIDFHDYLFSYTKWDYYEGDLQLMVKDVQAALGRNFGLEKWKETWSILESPHELVVYLALPPSESVFHLFVDVGKTPSGEVLHHLGWDLVDEDNMENDIVNVFLTNPIGEFVEGGIKAFHDKSQNLLKLILEKLPEGSLSDHIPYWGEARLEIAISEEYFENINNLGIPVPRKWNLEEEG